MKSIETQQPGKSTSPESSDEVRGGNPVFWQLAVYASFLGWLAHSFAVRSLVVSLQRLLAKFLLKA
jgi:hypothetical protein